MLITIDILDCETGSDATHRASISDTHLTPLPGAHFRQFSGKRCACPKCTPPDWRSIPMCSWEAPSKRRGAMS